MPPHFVLDEIPDETRIPIGRPLSNYRAYVLDASLPAGACRGVRRALHRGAGLARAIGRAG